MSLINRILHPVKTIRRDARNEALSEAGRALVEFSEQRFSKGDREAAFWDAAHYVVDELGDGEFRWPGGKRRPLHEDVKVVVSTEVRPEWRTWLAQGLDDLRRHGRLS